jgi:hypothetical protein
MKGEKTMDKYSQEAMEMRLQQTMEDLKSGKIQVDFTQQIYDKEEGKYYPKWMKENGLTYALDEVTFLYLPLLTTDEEQPYEMGMWGQRRLEYLKAEKPGIYENLMIQGLWEHLTAIDKAAYEMEDILIAEMSKAEGITEELKANNQMEWVAQMNNLKNRVREIIYNELIYS